MAFVSHAKSQMYQGPSAAASEPLYGFLEEGRGRIKLNLGDPLPSGSFHVDLMTTFEPASKTQASETSKGAMEMTFELTH